MFNSHINLSCTGQCFHLVVANVLCISFMFVGEDTKGDEAAWDVVIILKGSVRTNYKKQKKILKSWVTLG